MFPTEPVPEQIGAYKVIRRLTGSGSADVYLGRMEGPMGFQRVCALKLVPNAIEGDVRLAEELAREASICARLNHPAIVRMFDFFEQERRLVLVLEHVEGADLDRLLQNLARRRQKLGDEAIWYLARELVGALAHAHAATDETGSPTPVIHRNLQPENVLVSWDGQVRLTGFGLGKIVGRTPDTVVGTIKGTPGYMAPEQARGERVTSRADVYGFGVLLWSLLTGRRPPSDGTRLESISKIRTDIPREIAAAIDAALEPAPDKRKITCTEIEQWITKLAKMEAGRSELREKVLNLRGARSAVGEPGATETTRPRPMPRRRVSFRGIRASQRPAGPGPLSAPPPMSTRPALRISERPLEASRPPRAEGRPHEVEDLRKGVAWLPPIRDLDTIDELLDEARPAGHRAALPTQPDPPVAPTGGPPAMSKRAPQRTLLGGLTAGFPHPTSDRDAASGAEAAIPPSTTADATASVTKAVEPVHSTAPSAPASERIDDAGLGAWRDVGEGPAGASPAPTQGATHREDEAPPRAPAKRAARPLSAVESIGVASVTAGLVVAVGILLADRNRPIRAGAPEIASSALTSGVTALEHPETPPTASATGGALAPLPTSAPQASGTGFDLPGGFGYINVITPVAAMVFVNGTLAGPANEPVKALCGRRFIRLGTVAEANRFPAWVAPGRTVIIPCQATIRVEITPSPSPQP